MYLPSIDRLRSWATREELFVFVQIRDGREMFVFFFFFLKSERRTFKQTEGTAFGIIYSQFLPSCLSQFRLIACCWFCYQTPSEFLLDSLKLPCRQLLSCRFSFLLFCCLLRFLLASLPFSHSLRLVIEFNSNRNLLTFVTHFSGNNNNNVINYLFDNYYVNELFSCVLSAEPNAHDRFVSRSITLSLSSIVSVGERKRRRTVQSVARHASKCSFY